MKTNQANARRRLVYSRQARLIGTVNGRRVYRVPVRVSLNNSHALTSDDIEFEVIATGAADAANWVREQFATRPETEIYAYGPQGGETHRYVGWESAISAEMMLRRAAPVQLSIEL